MRLGKRQRLMGRAGAAALVVVVATATGGAGCGNGEGVVGGDCAAGYTDCNNQCVKLSSDPDNCGACGDVCSTGVCSHLTDARADGPIDAATDHRVHDASTKETGEGGGSGDAHAHDGATSDGGSGDAHAHDGGAVDAHGEAAATDAHAADAPITVDAGHDAGVDSCAGPYTTATQCGSCGAACPEGDLCSPVADGGVDAGGYFCVPMCALPYVACDGTCIDVRSDPDNCGACHHVCPSGLCTMGVCDGVTSGDIVIIGHDYAASNILMSEATLLSNAVFLPPTNPLRVLSFEQYAVPGQVSNVKATLHTYAPLGRSITYTVVNDYTTLSGQLSTQMFDALLVYDQALAPSGVLGTVGSTLAASLSSFVAVGGDVVVLDGASGSTRQMTSFLSMANLLQSSAETQVPATDRLLVVASGDAVGNFVLSPYAPIADTVYFTTSEANGGSVTYIVDDLTGGNLVPVVIHKTPPSGP